MERLNSDNKRKSRYIWVSALISAWSENDCRGRQRLHVGINFYLGARKIIVITQEAVTKQLDSYDSLSGWPSSRLSVNSILNAVLARQVCLWTIQKVQADTICGRLVYNGIVLDAAIPYVFTTLDSHLHPSKFVLLQTPTQANVSQCAECKELYIRRCKKCRRNEYCVVDHDASSATITHHLSDLVRLDTLPFLKNRKQLSYYLV